MPDEPAAGDLAEAVEMRDVVAGGGGRDGGVSG